MNTVLVHSRSKTPNPFWNHLQRYAELVDAKGGENLADFKLVVFDGDACQASDLVSVGAGRALEQGVAILILNARREHKAVPGAITGFHNHADSVAWLAIRRIDGHGRAWYRCLHQMPATKLGDVTLAEIPRARDGSTGKPELSIIAQTEVPPLTEADVQEFVNDALGYLSNEREDSTGAAPSDAIAWTGIDNIYHSIRIVGWQDAGFTPPSQTMTLTGTAMLGVYYDNVTFSDQPVQWVYINTAALIKTGSLVTNTPTAMGWILTGIQQSGPTPSYLNFVSGSPKTDNNSTSYTSSEEFTVNASVDKDGPSVGLSYTVGNSYTYNLTDWAITQTDEDGWQFYQQTPYNGVQNPLQPDPAFAKGGKIQNVPLISQTSLSFSSQTVWVANPPQQSDNTLSYGWTAWANYLDSDVGANDVWYPQSGWALPTDTWTINYSKALPSS